MTTLFVTGFKNIGRDNWETFQRSEQVYINKFLKMANAFHSANHKLVAWVEPYVSQKCNTARCEFLNINIISHFLGKYETIEQAIIDSPEYKILVPLHRKTKPEHIYAAYNLINHSKVNMIAHAKRLFPNYDYYMWVDFGCPDYPTHKLNISEVCKQNKVVYSGNLPRNPVSAKNMLASDAIYIYGSQFVVHKNVVEEYEKRYEETLLKLHSQGISDDDQNVVYQMTVEYPNLFQIVYTGEWFSMFKNLFNSSLFKGLNNNSTRQDVFDFFSNNLNTIVEIGTDYGTFSRWMLSKTQTAKLYCIDPYLSYDDYEDAINNKTGDTLYTRIRQEIENEYPGRVTFIRKMSKDAIIDIPNNIDFIYIDGNHKYKYVFEDLTLYFDKLRPGGIIVGDDAVDIDERLRDQNGDIFITWSHGCYGKYGVVKAFRDFIELNKNKIIESKIIGTQYIIVKSLIFN